MFFFEIIGGGGKISPKNHQQNFYIKKSKKNCFFEKNEKNCFGFISRVFNRILNVIQIDQK